MLSLRFAVISAVAAFVWACSSKESASPTSNPSEGDGGVTEDGAAGGGSASVCAATREYVLRCAGEGELDCGPASYDAWCASKDQKVNSEAFRKAEAKCLPTVGCDADERKDCDYKSYASETQTAAQKALVTAYCATCERDDTAGCASRVVTYEPSTGPAQVTDVFIAVWELADSIVDQIREQCTGAALPAGTDPCAKRFGSCAAGPYLDGLPECPP